MSQERVAAPGRPRDAAIEGRVLDEAIRLFGERGWSGFSIEKLSAATGVGKGPIYLRWNSKEELLLAALRSHLPDIRDLDTGTFRGDLLQFARQTLDLYFSPSGRAAERLVLDSEVAGTLSVRLEEWERSQFRAGRAIIERAVARGELSPSVSANLLLNVLTGAATSYSHLTSRASREKARSAAPRFAEQLVDFVLAGAGATDAAPSTTGPAAARVPSVEA